MFKTFIAVMLFSGCLLATCKGALPVRHWSYPITISVDASADVYSSDIVAAVSVWNKVAPLINVTNVSSDSISFMSKWDGTTFQMAYTAISSLFGIINRHSIRFNNSFMFFSGARSKQFGLISFRSVMLHELGHALGLDHNPNKDSVMYAYLNTDEVKLTLSKEDVTAIKCIYPVK